MGKLQHTLEISLVVPVIVESLVRIRTYVLGTSLNPNMTSDLTDLLSSGSLKMLWNTVRWAPSSSLRPLSSLSHLLKNYVLLIFFPHLFFIDGRLEIYACASLFHTYSGDLYST